MAIPLTDAFLLPSGVYPAVQNHHFLNEDAERRPMVYPRRLMRCVPKFDDLVWSITQEYYLDYTLRSFIPQSALDDAVSSVVSWT